MSGRIYVSSSRTGYLFILATCLFPSISLAQEITNVDFTVNESKVEITYDITACSGNEDYDVRLFLGQDGALLEIKQGLSGDLEHVTCGSSNMIVWDVLSDREELKGPIFFAVEILRVHPVVTDEYPIAYDDERPAGAVPYGNSDSSPAMARQPRPKAYLAPFGIFQLGAWIAFEQTRAVIHSHHRPNVVFQKRPSPAAPDPKRTRQR